MAGARVDGVDWRRPLLTSIPLALICAVVPYMLGAPLWRAIVIGLTGGVVLYLVIPALDAGHGGWPLPPADGALVGAGRARPWRMDGLDNAGTQQTVWAVRVRPRLAALASALLARRGITEITPAARELLGDRAIALLSDPEAAPPSAREVEQLCGLIAALATDGDHPVPLPPVVEGLVGVARTERTRP